jgi:hypothetical protein
VKHCEIRDRVPDAELTTITPEGAARWLTRKGWRAIGQATRGSWWIAQDHADDDYDAPTALIPCAGLLDHAVSVASAVEHLSWALSIPPRTIIAEMQADSRIVTECARIAGKKESP